MDPHIKQACIILNLTHRLTQSLRWTSPLRRELQVVEPCMLQHYRSHKPLLGARFAVGQPQLQPIAASRSDYAAVLATCDMWRACQARTDHNYLRYLL